MYAACFSIAGWAGPQEYIFTGGKLLDIADKFNDIQDITCLAMMAQQMGTEDPETIDKLLHFIERYEKGRIQSKELKHFDVNLAVGSMRCLKLCKGNEAVTQLIKEHPGAIVK